MSYKTYHTSKINTEYRKLFYKYCYYCKICFDYEIYLSLKNLPTPTAAESIDYHANVCCKDKKELKRKIEEEIQSIKEEEKKKRENKRYIKKELKEIKRKKNTLFYFSFL